MRLCLGFILIVLIACKGPDCSISDKLRFDTVSVLFEDGFKKDKIHLQFNNQNLLDSIITTDPSSGVATDFIGLPLKINSENKMEIQLNNTSYTFSVNEFSCFKSLIIRKKNNIIKIFPTNKQLNYY